MPDSCDLSPCRNTSLKKWQLFRWQGYNMSMTGIVVALIWNVTFRQTFPAVFNHNLLWRSKPASPHLPSLIETCVLHTCSHFSPQNSKSGAKLQKACVWGLHFLVVIASHLSCLLVCSYFSPSHKLNFRSCLVANKTIREQQSAVTVITI